MLPMNDSEMVFHNPKARAKSWAFDMSTYDLRVAPILTGSGSFASYSPGSPLIYTVQSSTSNPSQMFHCPEHGCFRKFTRRYTLIEHMKTHTGEKPHICPAPGCRKRFSTSGNLSRHKRLHGFIKPLECPVDGCPSTFASNNKLEKHMKYHMGSPVHVCTIGTCGKTFSTMGNLNRHIKHQHQDAENEDENIRDSFTGSSDGSVYHPHSQSPTAADDFRSKQKCIVTKPEFAATGSSSVGADIGGFSSTMSMQRISPSYPAEASPLERPWNSDALLDSLATIFDEEASASSRNDSQGATISHAALNAAPSPRLPPGSLLDEMINFHVTNFQC
uniref:C2H2-type domain-containing protein n=1 Tax=Globisporangium ultimum (strain ATCC 200006 / CBS 805.95 / DAOM BR144) TaxID=431595 RepID=K3WUX7_GLOUD